MDPSATSKRAPRGGIYSPIQAFDQQMLSVGDGHTIYVEQSGNPQGTPIVVFHGGPGGGTNPVMRRFFDSAHYRIIMFDQRGCGRSTPLASVHANTTWHLVRDAETIRAHLGIEAWHLFGGSWGATLALIYAQAHPQRALSLTLRGVFLLTQDELDWFYGGGAGRFWPEQWAVFRDAIPQFEQDNLIEAYHKRLFCGYSTHEHRYAQCWAAWENALASVHSTGEMAASPRSYALAFARLENHYFRHRGWLDEDSDILPNMQRIAHLPGTIVQGRQDMVCPPASAYALSQAWPKARLQMIPAAGHAMSDPGIARALVDETDRLRHATAP